MPSDRAFIVNLPLILTLTNRQNWHRINSLKKHQKFHLTPINATNTDLFLIEIDIPSISLGSTFIFKKISYRFHKTIEGLLCFKF